MKDFKISDKSSIKDALKAIDKNKKGMIIIIDSDNVVIGICTDGDIRRKLLSGSKLDDQIVDCINKKFSFAKPSTKKEKIIKLLDAKIKFLPVLDDKNQLIDIYFHDHLPKKISESYIYRAKSPVRISFGGGGSDTTNYFLDEKRGAVINSTICLFSHASMELRNDSKVKISSYDLNEEKTFKNLEDLYSKAGNFGLIAATIKSIEPEFGFNLFLYSDYPSNSGLGGSAAVVSSILGCFNEYRNKYWDEYELAELAFQAERLFFSIDGGWQDQYATIFGGINFMEFSLEKNLIHPLKLRKDIANELQESLFLCNTDIKHDSGNIHADQKEKTKTKNIKDLIKNNIELTYEIRDCLLKGEIKNFGEQLHKGWLLKKQFSNKISSREIDKIYEFGISSGADGGKLLGAGGGGYFLFFVPDNKKVNFLNSFLDKNIHVSSLKFDSEGLSTWKVKK
tara:strand:+ start:262 stop:1617 length:1356 start_codon:yes stop_codon:yes gene_type:complete